MDLVLERILPGTPHEVFDMWLDPESLRHWMCPGNTSVARADVEPVVDGVFRIDMRVPDGSVLIHTGRYLEVRRPERLVFTWISTATELEETRVALDFYPHTDGCRLVLRHDQFPDERAADLHAAGWMHVLRRLAQLARKT